jgi:hypothetical protein
MTVINPNDKYFLDKTSEATYSLWNALLTVNGILVSAFSAVITFAHQSNKVLSIILVICCAISLILIIWNYLSTKRHYKEIGQRRSDENQNITIEQKKAVIMKTIRRYKFVTWREYISLFLLVIEAALVICIVLTTKTTA